MSTFAALKKNSGTDLDKLKKKIEETQNQEGGGDDRFWSPTVDKAGNGMAIIRFLPTPPADGDGSPWVRCFKHGFEGTGGWFIDDCLTTIEEKCPVCEYNRELWATEIKANQEIVRKQKRKLTYISNIYVISDPSNPENEGKVKLFKFGKKIFNKLKEAMEPEFPDEQPLNPFDLWVGANFKLKIRNVEGYRNYDKSEFEKPSALFGDDSKLEEVWNQEYSIKEFIDPAKFKSYKQLKDRLDKVLGLKKSSSDEEDAGDDTPGSNMNFAPDFASRKQEPQPEQQGGGSVDDDLAYFQGLAKE